MTPRRFQVTVSYMYRFVANDRDDAEAWALEQVRNFVDQPDDIDVEEIRDDARD